MKNSPDPALVYFCPGTRQFRPTFTGLLVKAGGGIELESAESGHLAYIRSPKKPFI